MNEDNNKELCLFVCARLEEKRNLTSAIVKSLDYEIKIEGGEMRSILSAISRLTEDTIEEIKKNIV